MKSERLSEAIREYISLDEWQIAETRKSLGEADQKDFATHLDVRKIVSKWARRKR